MEEYIIKEAMNAGVVRVVKQAHPRNPNKWGKKLAPWFDEKCREAKR